jgi:transposase-like protein
MKKLIASVTVAGLVVLGGGAVAGGIAGAATPTRTDAPAQALRHRALARGGLTVAAKAIGITRAELRQALRGGQTVAQVAQAHDVAPQKVIDAVVAKGTERIDAALAAGRISADRAANLKQKLPDAVTKLVNRKFDGSQLKATRARRVGAVKIAAATIGIPARELVNEVRSGKTVAQVAQAHDVAPQKVIDAVLAKAKERIAAAVASGRIDASRAQQLTERATARITKLVNDTPHRAS